MGGSSGGVIIRSHAVAALSDPIIHGQLPSKTCALVDAALDKDPSDWSHADTLAVAHAFSWALLNLA